MIKLKLTDLEYIANTKRKKCIDNAIVQKNAKSIILDEILLSEYIDALAEVIILKGIIKKYNL